MQRFTVAFNFLCVLLGLLYEVRHLSLSIQRKISVNVFYSTFTNVFFYFCHVFTFYGVFYLLVNVFFIYDYKVATSRKRYKIEKLLLDTMNRT